MKKILVISNNPLSNIYNNGKTIQSIISKWDSKDIAQLCFKEEPVCFDTCKNFYCFTDKDALNSIRDKTQYMGKQIDELSKVAQIPQVSIKKSGKATEILSDMVQWNLTKLVRELIWKNSNWKNKQLITWLDAFKPEVVFFVGGDSIFTYRITDFIQRRYQCKIVMYLTDDYLTPKQSISPFYWIRYHWIKNSFEGMLKKTSRLATIGDAMSEEYYHRYQIQGMSLMNAIKAIPLDEHIPNKPLIFVYMGGILLNRWKSLSVLGGAIDQINKEHKSTIAQLQIYTGSTITNQMEQALNIRESSRIIGHVASDQVTKILKQSDVLVHVEAFDKKNMHITRLSVSTKIPEYMMQNRCILGIGPEEVASMKYIKDFAIVLNSLSLLTVRDKVSSLISNPKMRTDMAKIAYEKAIENHDIDIINKKFNEMIDNIFNP